MKATNNTVIDQFIIEASLVQPVSKIIDQLKNGEFRDCDIKWLDLKFKNYIEFSAKTLGINGMMPTRFDTESNKVLNEYVVDKYLTRFTTLLEYFKSL